MGSPCQTGFPSPESGVVFCKRGKRYFIFLHKRIGEPSTTAWDEVRMAHVVRVYAHGVCVCACMLPLVLKCMIVVVLASARL